MTNLTFKQKIELESHDGIMLLEGANDDGTQVFAYVIMCKSKIEEISHAASDSTKQNLNDLGKVVLSGEGEPSAKQRRYMEEKYNFVH